MNIAIRSMNNCMTNVINAHTCSTGRSDLLVPIVLVVDAHLLKVIGDMISGPRVSVPIRINPIGPIRINPIGVHSSVGVPLIWYIVGVEAMPAVDGAVSFLEAHLTSAIVPLFLTLVLGVIATIDASLIATASAT
jgi:hypothetical protein